MMKQDQIMTAIRSRDINQLYELLIGESELNLRDVIVGDEGVSVIVAVLRIGGLSLTRITFWNTRIGDKGAEELADILRRDSHLKHIGFSYNKIGDRGVSALADALKTNSTLEGLDLGANNITNNGAAMIAAALPENNSLKFIHLGCPQVTTACIHHFVTALQRNTSLIDLVGNNYFFTQNDELAYLLQRNRSLQEDGQRRESTRSSSTQEQQLPQDQLNQIEENILNLFQSQQNNQNREVNFIIRQIATYLGLYTENQENLFVRLRELTTFNQNLQSEIDSLRRNIGRESFEAGVEISRLEAELRELRQRYQQIKKERDTLEERVDKLRYDLQTKDNKIDSQKAQIENLGNSVQRFEANSTDLQCELVNLRTKNQENSNRIVELESQLQEKEQSIGNLTHRIEDLKALTHGLEASSTTLQSELGNLQTKNKKLETEKATLIKEKQSLEKEQSQTQSNLRDLEQRSKEREQHKIEAKQKEIDGLKRQLADMRNSYTELQRKLETAEETNKDQTKIYNGLQKERDDLSRKLCDANQNLEKLKQQIEETKEEKLSTERQNLSYHEQVQSLQSRLEQIEKKAYDLQEETKIKQGKIAGLMSQLAEQQEKLQGAEEANEVQTQRYSELQKEKENLLEQLSNVTQNLEELERGNRHLLEEKSVLEDLNAQQQQDIFYLSEKIKEMSTTETEIVEENDTQQDLNSYKEQFEVEINNTQARFNEELIELRDMYKELKDDHERLKQKGGQHSPEIQRQLQEQELELEKLAQEQLIKENKNTALERFKQGPNLVCYYRTLLIKLEDIFISCKAMQGGFVEGARGRLGTCTQVISILGETIPLPGANFITNLIAFGLDRTAANRLGNITRHISELVTLRELENIAEYTARKLTEWYAPLLIRLADINTLAQARESMNQPRIRQFRLLMQNICDRTGRTVLRTEPYLPAKQVAEFAILWLLDALTYEINWNPDLDLGAKFVHIVTTHQNCGGIVNNFRRRLQGKLGLGTVPTIDNQNWNVENIYTGSGIQTQCGERWRKRGSVPYGYCNGDRDTAIARSLICEGIIEHQENVEDYVDDRGRISQEICRCFERSEFGNLEHLFNRIEYLDLSGLRLNFRNNLLVQALADAFHTNTIRAINLSNCNLDANSLHYLIEALYREDQYQSVRIESLDLSNNPNLYFKSEEDVMQLLSIPTLRRVNLTNTGLRDRNIQYIKNVLDRARQIIYLGDIETNPKISNNNKMTIRALLNRNIASVRLTGTEDAHEQDGKRRVEPSTHQMRENGEKSALKKNETDASEKKAKPISVRRGRPTPPPKPKHLPVPSLSHTESKSRSFKEETQRTEKGKESVQKPELSDSELLPIFDNRTAGLRYIPIPKDGHCLYRAVTLYLGGQDVDFLRQIIATNLEQNIEKYRPFIPLPANRTTEKYIGDIRSTNAWAGDLELTILMRILDSPIIVIGPDNEIRNRDVINRYPGDPIFVRYDGINHYDAFILRPGVNGREILARFTNEPTPPPYYTQAPQGFFHQSSPHADISLPPVPKISPTPSPADLFLYAVWMGDIPTINNLIEKVNPSDTRDSQGNNALHLAVFRNKTKILKLLAGKIDINITNNAGETPMDIAQQLNNQEVLNFFREYQEFQSGQWQGEESSPPMETP